MCNRMPKYKLVYMSICKYYLQMYLSMTETLNRDKLYVMYACKIVNTMNMYTL
jgi:hypothetical protein